LISKVEKNLRSAQFETKKHCKTRPIRQ